MTVAGTTANGTFQYRLIMTSTASDCAPDTSAISNLTVAPDPQISADGVNASICVGGTATFTTTVTGGIAPTFAWQYNNGGTWANVSNGLPAGATYSNQATKDLTVAGTTANGTFQYRLIMTSTASDCAPDTSAISNLTVNPDITVTTQSPDLTECVGDMQTITVTVNGGVGTVDLQWQRFDSLSSTWVNIPGQTTNTFTPPSTVGGVLGYRIVATNAVGVSGCQQFIGNEIKVYINAVSGGTIGFDQVICIDGDPDPIGDIPAPLQGEPGNTSAFKVTNNDAAASFQQKVDGNCENVKVSVKEVQSILTSNRTAYQFTIEGDFTANYLWNNGLTTPSILVEKNDKRNYDVIVKGENGCESTIKMSPLAISSSSK
ncbi:MAG: hypothetical protein IPL23_22525 [Saprospiraceae bacterium]|nr:hypothetical protein [Saprospiraceae bacterium]